MIGLDRRLVAVSTDHELDRAGIHVPDVPGEREGAVVQRAILDKNVVLDPGAVVGVDHDADRARGFTVTDSGITVVGKGVHVAA